MNGESTQSAKSNSRIRELLRRPAWSIKPTEPAAPAGNAISAAARRRPRNPLSGLPRLTLEVMSGHPSAFGESGDEILSCETFSPVCETFSPSMYGPKKLCRHYVHWGLDSRSLLRSLLIKYFSDCITPAGRPGAARVVPPRRVSKARGHARRFRASRCWTASRTEETGNLATERFEEAPVQPNDETPACSVGDSAVVRADAGTARGPRGLGCERYVLGEIRNPRGRTAQCGEWRVLRDGEGQPLSQRDH